MADLHGQLLARKEETTRAVADHAAAVAALDGEVAQLHEAATLQLQVQRAAYVCACFVCRVLLRE